MTKPSYFYKAYSHSASELAKKLWFYIHAVGWFDCLPDYDVVRSSYYDFQLKLVLKGKGYICQQGRTYPVGPGEIFYLDLNHAHRYYADPNDPWEVLWVHFGGQQASDYFEILEGGECPVFQVSDSVRIEQCFQELYQLFVERAVGFEARASAVLTEILTDLIVKRMQVGNTNPKLQVRQYPESIQRAMVYIEHHYQQTLKMEQIAQQALLSPFHFSRLFKRATGFTVMEYLLKFRLTQAKFLLTQTQLSIGEIAERVGFGDQSYFGKLFKKYEKISPKDYRSRFIPKLDG